MAQFEVNLRDLYRVSRKRKWIILVTPIMMAVLTYVLTPTPETVYQATSRVKISQSSNLAGILIEVLSYSQGDNLQTQSEVIKSQPVMARVGQKQGLIPPNLEFPDIVRNPAYVMVVNDLKAHVRTQRVGDSDIIEIVCTADGEKKAIDLANQVAEAYRQANIDERNKQITLAINFIEGQLLKTNQELREAEDNLRAFRQTYTSNLGGDLADSTAVRERVTTTERQLARARASLSVAERSLASESVENVVPVSSEADDDNLRRLNDQLATLLAEYNKLKLDRDQARTYQTDQHQNIQKLNNQLTVLQAAIRDRLRRLVERYRVLVSDLENTLSVQRRREVGLDQMPELKRQQGVIEREIERLTAMVNHNAQKLNEAKIQEAAKIEEVVIVEAATDADEQLERGPIYKTLVGFLIGLLLGGVFAFVLESLDTSIGTIEDVEKYLETVVLGVIPHIDFEQVKSRIAQSQLGPTVTAADVDKFAHLCTHFDPKSVTSEAYRTMRTNVDILLKKNKAKTILLTSSVLQEGKTTSATNLAVAFAQAGQRTMLIDADIRKPNVEKILGIDRAPGLTDVLLGLTSWRDALSSIDAMILGKYGLKNAQITPGLEYLFVLPAGRSVDNPAELLQGDRFTEMLAECREAFDVVLVDVSPILPVADASILAPQADGVLLAYQIGRVGRDVLKRSKIRMESVSAKIWGIVMNDIQAEIDYRRGDYQYYNYRYEESLAVPESLAGRVRTGVGSMFGAKGRSEGKAGPGRSQALSRITPVDAAPSPPPAPAATVFPARTPPEPPPGPGTSSELRDIMNLTDDDDE